ncbi:MAG TPA: Do family serine endopeptidase [Polyangiaceae bacterium]|nr:Do family serine endopeptidase [Polyangiaceae bacterium]
MKTKHAFGTVLVCSSLFACGWVGGVFSSGATKKAAADSTAQPPPAVPQAREVGDAFVEVADRLAPSVVQVTVRGRARPAAGRFRGQGNPFEGTPFERFFDHFGDSLPREQAPATGMGSGVAIDDQGHILTNNHVVEDAEEVRVKFVDGKELAAKVVGTDPKTDLAVIKVDGKTQPAAFGDAAKLRVGEWVIAIGNPFGLDHSVTVGVLSAKGRYGFAPGKLEDFLQTDASINPGNSGGPLVNLNGKIIGINTMIAGLGTGVGFAVSEAIAKPIARQLIEHGTVKRAFIGIVMQSLSPDLRQALGAKAPEKGALVSQVQKDSPAARAGIRVGDIVTRVAGKATEDSRAVQHAVLELKVGEEVQITVWRDGKDLDLKLKTAELPAEATTEGSRSRGNSDREGKLGIALQTLTPELAERLDLDRSLKGAVITAVRPQSPAARAGLRNGDLIVEVDRTPIANADEAVSRLSAERDGGHLVRVQRADDSIFVVLSPTGKAAPSP